MVNAYIKIQYRAKLNCRWDYENIILKGPDVAIIKNGI
jgi:hypothetical protein